MLRYDNRVAVVTGAGGGLGKAYALLLAHRGCKVVVNDLGGTTSGQGSDTSAANQVVQEIRARGGEAVPDYHSVEQGDKIIETAVRSFGTIDILICNAGILRDRSFVKMDDNAWDAVMNVHLHGSYSCARAAWPIMREKGYGRIVMITSASGIYGNFGQANYAAAKMGLIGLANTLSREGNKRNILVNAVAPIAASRMTEGLMPPELLNALHPDAVAPLVAYLCHESCTTTGGVYELGGGWMSRLRWQRSNGTFLDVSQGPPSVETVAEHWNEVEQFDERATYPDSTQAAFGPMMDNLNRSAEKKIHTKDISISSSSTSSSSSSSPLSSSPLVPLPGGNIGKSDNVDVEGSLRFQFKPIPHSYSERDVALYALSVGANNLDPLDTVDLKFTYELNPTGFVTLPTFAVLFPHTIMAELTSLPTLKFNPMMLLHGEQEIILPNGVLPTSARTITEGKITNIYDKGVGAVLIFEAVTYIDNSSTPTTNSTKGLPIAYNRSSIFLRGIGNFQGDRGPLPEPWKPLPSVNQPLYTATYAIPPSAALLYRLNGDTNPLHADPDMASIGGFKQPILHGLATYGITGKILLKYFGNDDPSTLKSIKARFAKHVFPGETLIVEMWNRDETSSSPSKSSSSNGIETRRILFQCKIKERDNVLVLSHGVAVFEVPVAKL